MRPFHVHKFIKAEGEITAELITAHPTHITPINLVGFIPAVWCLTKVAEDVELPGSHSHMLFVLVCVASGYLHRNVRHPVLSSDFKTFFKPRKKKKKNSQCSDIMFHSFLLQFLLFGGLFSIQMSVFEKEKRNRSLH